MKPARKPFAVKMAFSFSFLFLILIFSQSSYASTITGFVFDKQRNPVMDVDVELLDDLYRMMPNGRQKTDAMGRYQFNNLPNGFYTIRVLPFRHDLEDQQQTTEIQTMTVRGQGSGNAYITMDFYLLPKKGGLRDAELSVVFAQNVPKEAEAAFKQAGEDFSKKRDEQAFNNLIKALQIMPTYYQALYRYGVELFNRRQFKESASVFMEAVKVNEKSASSFYYLGASLNGLGKDYNKAAVKSLNVAYTLAPASIQVLYKLGKVERELGDFANAEKHLLQAKKLAPQKDADLHMELAMLYANDLKKFREAADELELYLKSSKAKDGEEEKKIKKLIADLREKAKTQT